MVLILQMRSKFSSRLTQGSPTGTTSTWSGSNPCHPSPPPCSLPCFTNEETEARRGGDSSRVTDTAQSWPGLASSPGFSQDVRHQGGLPGRVQQGRGPQGREGRSRPSRVWSDRGVEATEQLCWGICSSACRLVWAGKGHGTPHSHINEDICKLMHLI